MSLLMDTISHTFIPFVFPSRFATHTSSSFLSIRSQ